MALTAVPTAEANAWMAIRPGLEKKGMGAGSMWNCLVSDVAIGDYLVGARARVTGVSGTTTRTLSAVRSNGEPCTFVWTGSTSTRIVR